MIWKSRLAYQNRIYYQSQLSSKLYYYNDRYHAINRQLDNLKEPVKSHYQGKKTRLKKRHENLTEQLYYYDEKSDEVFMYVLSKIRKS